MYLSLVFLPLFGALGAGFGGRWIGPVGAVRLTTSLLATSFVLRLIAFVEVGLGGAPLWVNALTWVERAGFVVNWEFYYDRLTVVMCVVVTSVSTLVHLYGGSYMDGDPHRPRFMAYLSLFTFFMLILVTARNYLQLFVGWEGVGLCSYLLINFWFTRIQANKAAIKAMMVNRVGDLFLAIAMVVLFVQWGRLDFARIFPRVPLALEDTILILGFDVPVIPLVGLLLFLGAMGKSAQLFLHTWLPDAMEGPTPVRALIHAATMVTAGVFLLVRRSPLLEYTPGVLAFITLVGARTAFMAATTGLVQNDLKRVIAYSTCSQLGYMVFACGLSGYGVAVFHLANHAFFKALLFLGAGAVIHAMADEQDMRRMGGLARLLPFTYRMMFIGRISLMGFPFMTGFYSKDLILELAYGSYSSVAWFAHLLGSLSAFFTAFYRIRLLYLTFLAPAAGYRSVTEGAHDPPLAMGLPLFLLSWGAIFVGYLGKDLMVGPGTSFWGAAIFVHPDHCAVFEREFMPASIKLVPVILSLAGGIRAYLLYQKAPAWLYRLKQDGLGRELYTFFNRKWLFDAVYTRYLVQPTMDIRYQGTYKTLDRGVFEALGPLGISRWISQSRRALTQLQTGHVAHYASLMLWGLLGVVGFLGVYPLLGGFALGGLPALMVVSLVFYLI